MIDAAMTLTDGRTLAYTELGASNAPAVFYFHGAPGSRLDLTAYDDAFTRAGVRVVTTDRPGYGRSSPQPGRHLNDWPSDVAALADYLHAERFAVMGLSSGGPYAVASAALLPDRVGGAAVVAGVSDFGWPDAWEGFVEWETTVMRLDDEAEATRWCEKQFGADGSKFFEAVAEDPVGPADEAFLADATVMGWLSATFSEAFRQGVGGYAQDTIVQGRRWSFDPDSIVAPVLVVHGEDDTFVPVRHSRHTAELIPGATLRVMPGHGHISLFTELPNLSAELRALLL